MCAVRGEAQERDVDREAVWSFTTRKRIATGVGAAAWPGEPRAAHAKVVPEAAE